MQSLNWLLDDLGILNLLLIKLSLNADKLHYVFPRKCQIVFDDLSCFFFFCSRDTTVKLWDAETGKFLRNYGGHTEAVNCARLVRTG